MSVGEIGRAVGALTVHKDKGNPAQAAFFITIAGCSGKMGIFAPRWTVNSQAIKI